VHPSTDLFGVDRQLSHCLAALAWMAMVASDLLAVARDLRLCSSFPQLPVAADSVGGCRFSWQMWLLVAAHDDTTFSPCSQQPPPLLTHSVTQFMQRYHPPSVSPRCLCVCYSWSGLQTHPWPVFVGWPTSPQPTPLLRPSHHQILLSALLSLPARLPHVLSLRNPLRLSLLALTTSPSEQY
jgi:hypothetical protein